MKNETKLTIVKKSMSELQRVLFRRSVAFFTPIGTDEMSFGSGTLVSVGDKLFIATAGHIIADAQEEEVWALAGESQDSRSPAAPVLRKGKYPDNDPDVGFLELGTISVSERLKKDACPLELLANYGCGRPLRPTILVGSPAEYLKRSGSALIPQFMAYYAMPMTEDEWEKTVDPDTDKDIFLDYPDTPAEEMGSGASMLLPNPKGMSGGGVWDQGFEDGVIWTNQSAKLIGIQSRWNDQSRYVRAVQIIHWLRLIHSSYPDARPLLEQHFADLS